MPAREIFHRILLVTVVGVTTTCPSYSVPAQENADFVLSEEILVRVGDAAGLLDALRSRPIGLFPLAELEQLGRWYPAALLKDTYREVMDQPDTDPLVRAVAAHRLARAHLADGDLEASEALIAREGYLTHWSIVGPFPNDGMAGFHTAYEPELHRGMDAVYLGRFGQTQWRDVSGWPRSGYVDLSLLAQPAHSAVVYAASEVDVPRACDARLWTCIDGAFKVWLNGLLVAELDTDLGGTAIREWWDVRLEEGVNHLVIKTASEEDYLGFYLRITDADGLPLEGLHASAQLLEDSTALQQGESREPAGNILLALEQTALQDPPSLESSQVLAGAALVLRVMQPRDPTEPWRRYLSTGQTCTEGSAHALYLCSLVQDQYWQRQRSLLRAIEQTDESDPFRPWLQAGLAELYYHGLGEELFRRAGELVQQILAVHPDFIPALLLRGQILERRGLYWLAQEAFERAVSEAPDSPEVLYEATGSYRESGNSPPLYELYSRLARVAADASSVYLWLAPALVQQGRTDQAFAALQRALEIDPLSLPLRYLQANLLLSQDELERAQAVHLEVVSLFPTSPSAWEELGRFYVRTGDLDRATEAFSRSLAIEPQNRDLSQYRSAIQEETEEFFHSFTVDSDTFEQLRLSPELAGDRDFYFLVDQEINLIHANGLGTRYVQQAFQVQTRHGADALRQVSIEFTPDQEVVRILIARIIKPGGQIRESFDSWEESLSQPWYGLYYDIRGLVLRFEDLSPGDILEIQYTLSGTSSQNLLNEYFGDFWYVQDVQPKSLSRYGVIHPTDMTLNLRLPDLPHSLTHEEVPEGILDLVEIRDVPHVEQEVNMPGFSSVADYIHVSSFDSWERVAAWYWNLVKDELVSSPEIEAAVARLIDGLSTTRERVTAIHQYVVRNMRYVGLEFGIHGFRPYRTSVSFGRRFGDCKDTASLMKVMLDLAGIESHLVLVRTSNRGTIDPHPASLAVFNHVILYVPEIDLFLDGTTGHAGLDEPPPGDQGASALIVFDGQEHRFVTIPYVTPADNRFEYRFLVDLTRSDSPVQGSILATGQFAPPVRQRYEAVQQRLEEFEKEFRLEYPGASLTEVEFSDLEDITRPVQVQLQFHGVSWLRQSGGALLMTPLGVESNLASRYAGSAGRRLPLYLGPPFSLRYEITYQLPEGLMPALSQTRWDMSTPYGRFVMDMSEGDGLFTVNAQLEITATQVPVGDYTVFREFVIDVEQAVNQSIRLIPREERDES